MSAPKNSERGVKMAVSMCMHPPESLALLFGANPKPPICAQPVAVLVGVIAAARVGIAVHIDAVGRRVAVSPGPIAVGIARAAIAVGCSVAVGIAPGAVGKVALTGMEARTTTSDDRRTRNASGPGTRRTAGTRETSKTAAEETGRSTAGERRRATGRRRQLGERCVWRDYCSAKHRARGHRQKGFPQHRVSP
jgi:hypothetical protein